MPELCFIAGMSEAMRSNFRVMKDVAQYTRLTPAARQKTLQAFIELIYESPEAKACFEDWGLKLAQNTLSISGRLMSPSTLLFGNNYKEVVGPKGDWARATTCKPVLLSIPLQVLYL